MRSDVITQVVPNADPEFIQILERLPEPPAVIHEKLLQLLPKMYGIFLAKRAADRVGDTEEFARLMQKELDLLQKTADL
ncbi:MAG: hypothetical protein RDU25_01260 [Patescibacteria group bacterium]|nr:hypothetical protein [Patescibacteria group bacterium]